MYWLCVASFPGSHAREREIEVVIYVRVPGEPGNEARLCVFPFEVGRFKLVVTVHNYGITDGGE